MQITSILSNIRSWLACGNRSKWLIFISLCFVLFLKTVLFQYLICRNIYISSLWKNPTIFFAFWGGKIAPIIVLSAFIWIAKKQWWTMIVCLLIDIWIVANVFYFKANGMLLTVESMLMVDNLNGFWDSLKIFMNIEIFIYPIISIIYIIVVWLLDSRSERNYLIFTIWIITSMIVISATNYSHIRTISHKRNNNFIDCSPGKFCYTLDKYATEHDIHSPQKYVTRQSIISYFPAIFSYYFQKKEVIDNVELLENDKKEIENLLQDSKHVDITPQYNLVYVLVESLESWVLDDVASCYYMPNLNKLMKQYHTFVCDNLKTQVKHGVSADGQLINMTGLLPISAGATCKLYGTNMYPNLAHFYPQSAIINPVSGIWNQAVVTKSYGFHELIECRAEYQWNDMQVIEYLWNYIQSRDSSFCVLGITIDSHMPFVYGSKNVYLHPMDMPQIMSNYLNSLHYTDSCIGVLLDSVLNSPLAENTTIVITGDHTIFRDEIGFSDMNKYAQDNSINFKAGHTFTPLIIYSPNIEGNIHISDTCYQMDIFPTILHLIGAEDYYWQGLGINLLDSVARKNRQITESEAFRLSDLIIRSDYFRNYCTISDSIVQSE